MVNPTHTYISLRNWLCSKYKGYNRYSPRYPRAYYNIHKGCKFHTRKTLRLEKRGLWTDGHILASNVIFRGYGDSDSVCIDSIRN